MTLFLSSGGSDCGAPAPTVEPRLMGTQYLPRRAGQQVCTQKSEILRVLGKPLGEVADREEDALVDSRPRRGPGTFARKARGSGSRASCGSPPWIRTRTDRLQRSGSYRYSRGEDRREDVLVVLYPRRGDGSPPRIRTWNPQIQNLLCYRCTRGEEIDVSLPILAAMPLGGQVG